MPIPAGRAMLPPNKPVYIAKIEPNFESAIVQNQAGFQFSPFKDVYGTQKGAILEEGKFNTPVGSALAWHAVSLPPKKTQEINKGMMGSATPSQQENLQFTIAPDTITNTRVYTQDAISLAPRAEFDAEHNRTFSADTAVDDAKIERAAENYSDPKEYLKHLQETMAQGDIDSALSQFSKGKIASGSSAEAAPLASKTESALPWHDKESSDQYFKDMLNNSSSEDDFMRKGMELFFGPQSMGLFGSQGTSDAQFAANMEAALKASKAETYKNTSGESSGKGQEVASSQTVFNDDMDDDAALQAAIALSLQSSGNNGEGASGSGSRS